MEVLFFVLLLLSLICFIASAFAVIVDRMNLVALGLAFAIAVELIKYGQLL